MLHLFISLIILSFYVISFIDHGRSRTLINASNVSNNIPFNLLKMLKKLKYPKHQKYPHTFASKHGNFKPVIDQYPGEKLVSHIAGSLHSTRTYKTTRYSLTDPADSAMIFFFSIPASKLQADPTIKQLNDYNERGSQHV